MFNPVKTVQTVSEFTSSLKGLIESSHPFTNIEGEVSNLRIPYSGHMYFILKDDQAQIRAVLFKGQRRFLQETFKDGDKIICRGRVTIYEPRGEYQIIVDSVEKGGHGSMHIDYLALKEKLDREGLFKKEHKRLLPLFPQKICLITSPTGAAVHDFLKIALQRHPNLQVEIIATPMQGEQAPRLIREALYRGCQRKWADVIVLCRGGGSIEDLWAFNDEQLAREIARATIPVISAIGHEVDFTIADFVADLRAQTPTDAAQLIIPDMQELKGRVTELGQRLTLSIQHQLKNKDQVLRTKMHFLGDPKSTLDQHQLKMDYLMAQLELAFSHHVPQKKELLARLISRLHLVSPEKELNRQSNHFNNLKMQFIAAQKTILGHSQEKLQHQALILNALSPLAVLGRGYAITTNQKSNTVLSSIHHVQKEDVLAIKLQDGIIVAQTIKTNPD